MAHPNDEVLGAGASIWKWAHNGDQMDVCIMCTEAIELSPGGPVVAVNIPIGQWHTVRALESGTVIMEVKDGPYEPTGGGRYTGFVIGLIGCDLGIGLQPVAGG